MISVINPGCLLFAYFASSKCLLSLPGPGHTSINLGPVSFLAITKFYSYRVCIYKGQTVQHNRLPDLFYESKR